MERLEANTKIIHIIEDYIRTYPTMRFGQALSNLGIASHSLAGVTEVTCPVTDATPRGVRVENFYRDIFFEESDITLEKLLHGRSDSTESSGEVSE